MEYWDIYDVNKQPTGRTMKRNDWNMKPGDYHLTVLGVLQNREGKYLITKRVMTKAWAAGWWEVSGGGVQAGESSIEAVRREVIEETGIDVSDFDGGLQFTYRRDNPDEKDNYFVDVYKFTGDFSKIDIRPQEAETFYEAKAVGVEVLNLTCRVTRDELEIVERWIPDRG